MEAALQELQRVALDLEGRQAPLEVLGIELNPHPVPPCSGARLQQALRELPGQAGHEGGLHVVQGPMAELVSQRCNLCL